MRHALAALALLLCAGIPGMATAQDDVVPLPPQRPQPGAGAPLDLGQQDRAVDPPPGANLGAASSGDGRAPPETQKEAIARVNAWLNGFSVMTGTFTQVGADGAQATGKFYISKPGRLRFQYDPPSSIELVSNGRSVAVRDRKLNTQDLYLLSQTPLRFLLEERLDLASDASVMGVSVTDGIVAVRLEERNAIGGTAQIILYFSASDDSLQRWTIIDPQGFETAVAIAGVDTSRKPPDRLFEIDDNPL